MAKILNGVEVIAALARSHCHVVSPVITQPVNLWVPSPDSKLSMGLFVDCWLELVVELAH